MKISVITATFNSGKTVKDTIESVLRQTHKDIEYLIIDGGSTDDTMDIVRSYEPRFKGRMRYISERDRGIYDAMNKGIAMATGDVVGILNSDDFYTSPNILEQVAKTLTNTNIDAVYGDVHYVSNSNLEHYTRYYSSRLFHRNWMRFGFMPAHPSFYCRRSVYEQYGTFDLSYKVAADFENLLRLIFVHRIRIRYIAKDFVTMRTGGASSSGLRSHRQIMHDHLQALKRNGVYSNFFFLGMRYPYKLCEITLTKINNVFNNTRKKK